MSTITNLVAVFGCCSYCRKNNVIINQRIYMCHMLISLRDIKLPKLVENKLKMI